MGAQLNFVQNDELRTRILTYNWFAVRTSHYLKKINSKVDEVETYQENQNGDLPCQPWIVGQNLKLKF